MTAPPRQIGDRLLPARARPVPFCFQGFAPPPLHEVTRLRRRRAGAARCELTLHHLVQQVLAHRSRDDRRGDLEVGHVIA